MRAWVTLLYDQPGMGGEQRACASRVGEKKMLFLLLLSLLSGVTSTEDNSAVEPLSDFNYICLDTKLSTEQSGPFKAALGAGTLGASRTGVEAARGGGDSENKYGPIAAALRAHGAPEVPDAITILKDGTLCFRGDAAPAAANGTRTQEENSSPSQDSLYRAPGVPGEMSTSDGDNGHTRIGPNAKTPWIHGRRMAEIQGGAGDAELQLKEAQDTRVDPEISSTFPFTAIGGLENGCTGSLIGRCHVLTAGHCALHPTEFQISTELRFTPAQNGKQTDAPFGTFDFIDVKIARRWAIFSDPAHDIALIHIKGIGDLVDKRLGYLHVGDGGRSDKLANLNLAGYPEDKEDGHMWYDYCREIPFMYGRRRFINHSCRVEKGNSGSPMWVYKSNSGVRQTRAVHVAELTYGRQLDDNLSEVVQSSPQAVILSGSLLEEIQMWMKEMPCT